MASNHKHCLKELAIDVWAKKPDIQNTITWQLQGNPKEADYLIILPTLDAGHVQKINTLLNNILTYLKIGENSHCRVAFSELGSSELTTEKLLDQIKPSHALGFGVKLKPALGKKGLKTLVETLGLDEVIKDPQKKKQVADDLRKFCDQATIRS